MKQIKISAGYGQEIGIITLITAVGLAIRIPYFFPPIINWDESTFIIIGQSTIDGFLPYQVAWDVKPPFVFWWFGAAIELFGKTIPAVRLAGTLWLTLSAYLLYRAAFSLTRCCLASLVAAVVLIVGSSIYALHVSTEHLALVPMAASLLVLLNDGRRLHSVFLGGFLLGIALVFRLNLVYLCFVVGIYLCVSNKAGSQKELFIEVLKKATLFSVGVITPTLLGFLPYLVSGATELWITVYEAAVSYSGEQRSFSNAANALRESSSHIVGALIWGAALLGALNISRRWRDLCMEQQSKWLLCTVFFIGSFLSIVMTGPLYEHYFIQLAPGLSIFTAASFISHCSERGLSKAEVAKIVFVGILITLSLFQPFPTYPRTAAEGWMELARRLWSRQPLSYGQVYEIADFIRNQGRKNYTLFMMDGTLVYWLLSQYPPTRLATHPSALSKPFLREYLEPDSKMTKDALHSVFLRQPTFVVWHPNLFYLDASSVGFVDQELITNYVHAGQIGSWHIFRRVAQ